MDTFMIDGQSPLKKRGIHDEWNNQSTQNSLVFDIIEDEKAELSIAILADNSRKKELKSLLSKYADFLENKVSTIYSTDSTKNYILKKTGYKGIFLSIPSGRLDVDKVISSKII